MEQHDLQRSSTGWLFLVSSTITLSKTMRDKHESQRLINRVSEARTN